MILSGEKEGGFPVNPSPMLLLPGEPLPLPGSGGRREGQGGCPDLSEAGEGCPESVCVSLPLSQSLSLWVLDAKPPPVVKALATREGEGGRQIDS